MKIVLIAAAVFAILFIGQRLLAGDVISPEEAARRVAAGTAILIDVREPAEWRDGVVTGALLLPLSDLSGDRAKWKPVLDANRNKEFILYCRSGNRSGQAIRILTEEKLKATNAGGFSSCKAAGHPIKTP